MSNEMPTAGTKAPDFTLPRDGGGTISLADLKGGNVVVYFYPKDNTPGCTIEAKDFTAMGEEFAAANTTVIGVSKDSVKKHDNFIAKQELRIILASDQDSDLCERFGAWGEKQMYGKTYEGIFRSTFLINAEGIVVQAWPSVKVKGHAQEVLAAAQAL